MHYHPVQAFDSQQALQGTVQPVHTQIVQVAREVHYLLLVKLIVANIEEIH